MSNALAFYHFFRPCGLDAQTAATLASKLRTHYLHVTRQCAIDELATRPEWAALAAELTKEKELLQAAISDLAAPCRPPRQKPRRGPPQPYPLTPFSLPAMTPAHSCPAATPAPTAGTYQVLPPPTTLELLVRLRRRLGVPHHPFDYALEMARHREYFLMDVAVGRERMLAGLEAQRASLAYLNNAGTR